MMILSMMILSMMILRMMIFCLMIFCLMIFCLMNYPQQQQHKQVKHKTLKINKMDKILKKMGMSDTLHELKFNTPSQSARANETKTKHLSGMIYKNEHSGKGRICACKEQDRKNKGGQNKLKLDRSNISPQSIDKFGSSSSAFRLNIKPSSQRKHSQYQSSYRNVSFSLAPNQAKFQSSIATQSSQITQLISHLSLKLSHKCPIPNHQHNKTSYICLQTNCSANNGGRIGCAYCFMHEHSGHERDQIATLIKQLEQLEFKVKANGKLFENKICLFYDEFIGRIDTEIDNIREQFQVNIAFLKMKVKNQFQVYFKEKYQAYLEKDLSTVSSFNDGQMPTDLIGSKRLQLATALKFDDGMKLSKRQMALYQAGQVKIRQKLIQQKLVKLNFESIYQFLHKRLQVLHFESVQSGTLIEFVQQLNSSITHLFSAFKRNLPKIFLESQRQNQIEKPAIIRAI